MPGARIMLISAQDAKNCISAFLLFEGGVLTHVNEHGYNLLMWIAALMYSKDVK